jgi:hypothetical protein
VHECMVRLCILLNSLLYICKSELRKSQSGIKGFFFATAPGGSDTSRVTSGQNPDVMDGHIQPKMGHLQPSRVTSRVTSSQKWRTSSPPATFVRNRVLYVKFMPNIQRAQRALSPCRSENHIQNHIHAKFVNTRCQITSGVTSMQNSEDSSHI